MVRVMNRTETWKVIKKRPGVCWSAQAFIDHEAAGGLQLAQRAGNELLRLVAEIAPRCQLEILELTVPVFERREQTGQAERRMRAGVERQQQQLQVRHQAV